MANKKADEIQRSHDNAEDSKGLFSFPKSFQEFQIDILGGLVPGVLFLIGACAAVFPLIYKMNLHFAADPYLIKPVFLRRLLIAMKGTPSTVWFFTYLGLGIFTYVIGHLFYRRDPKDVDKSSFKYLARRDKLQFARTHAEDKEKRKAINHPTIFIFLHKILKIAPVIVDFLPHFLCNLAIGNKFFNKYDEEIRTNLRENYGAKDDSECEFPYPDMKAYLDKRKLKHLSEFIIWDNNQEPDSDDNKPRSKVYLNILKTRMSLFFPNHVKQLVRNEAHVRLASSTWHVCVSQRWFSMLVIVSFLIFSVLQFFLANPGNELWINIIKEYYPLLIWPSIALLAAEYCRAKIDMFFHYQRMREVVCVLENAYALFSINDFDKLSEPFDEVKKKFQQKRRGTKREEPTNDLKIYNSNQEFIGNCHDLSCKGLRIVSDQIKSIDDSELFMTNGGLEQHGPFRLSFKWGKQFEDGKVHTGYQFIDGSINIAQLLTEPETHNCYSNG